MYGVNFLSPFPTEPALSNPYSPTTADLSRVQDDGATYLPKLFEIKGRIGRVRYLAYSVMSSLLAVAAIMVIGGVLAAISPGLMAVAAILYIPMLAISFILAARRLNDLNHSGWWSLMMLVPFINFVLGLYLLFAPGTAGSNNHGPAPSANTRGVVIAAWSIPVLAVVIGILAAIAVPAYQEYVTRAQAAKVRSEAAP